MNDPKQAYSTVENTYILDYYEESDSRTWPFFPIVMPSKDGKGPASDKECDTIEWEVWDMRCNSYGTFKYLYQAIETAMLYNKEWLEDV